MKQIDRVQYARIRVDGIAVVGTSASGTDGQVVKDLEGEALKPDPTLKHAMSSTGHMVTAPSSRRPLVTDGDVNDAVKSSKTRLKAALTRARSRERVEKEAAFKLHDGRDDLSRSARDCALRRAESRFEADEATALTAHRMRLESIRQECPMWADLVR